MPFFELQLDPAPGMPQVMDVIAVFDHVRSGFQLRLCIAIRAGRQTSVPVNAYDHIGPIRPVKERDEIRAETGTVGISAFTPSHRFERAARNEPCNEQQDDQLFHGDQMLTP